MLCELSTSTLQKKINRVVDSLGFIFLVRGNFRMTDVFNPSYFVDPEVPADWFISFPLKDLEENM